MLRHGLAAGVVAGALSGLPSTVHAVATGRSPLAAAEAAGTMLLAPGSSRRRLLAAGAVAHTAISLGWGVVLAAVLPRRATVAAGGLAGLAIAALDLGVVARRYPAVLALPQGAQVADHVAFGAVAAAVVAHRRRQEVLCAR